jgi:hypothetical protein
MKRRDFIHAGLSLGVLSTAAALTPARAAAPAPAPRPPAPFRPDDWASVRDQFPLSRDVIHMTMLLSPQEVVASTSPYRVSHARVAPSLVNDEDEVDRTMAVLRAMA